MSQIELLEILVENNEIRRMVVIRGKEQTKFEEPKKKSYKISSI